MKIACVQTFPIDYCIDYVNAVAALGDVTFFAAAGQMRDHVDFIETDVETVLLPWPRHRSPSNLGLMHRLRQGIMARDPDVVHFLGDSVTWLSVMPSLVGKRPVVVTVHDAIRHLGDTKSSVIPLAFADLFHKQAHRLIVHGETIRTLLAERAKRPLDQLDIVPHPALKRYANLAQRRGLFPRRNDETFRLLFFGRVMTYKGLPYLFDAMQELEAKQTGIELTIAGRGPAYDEIAERLDSQSIKVRPEFVPEVEVAQLFLDADLIVLPYIGASQSGILAMAAAFGRAVLVTDVGELGDITRRTKMGMIVPPRNAGALAHAIRNIQNQPLLKAELEANSASAATDGAFSPSIVAEAAAAAYQRAIAGCSTLRMANVA